MAFALAVPVLAQQAPVSAHVRLAHHDNDKVARTDGGVVVWLRPLDPVPVSSSSQPKRLKLVQSHKTFEPHVLVVQVGSVVDFPNYDPFFHNVFSLFEGKRFDLGLYEAGTSRSVIFNRAGISYIFCNIHPEMSAVVIALKTPYFGISDRKGSIVISHVPAGMYQLDVWHERVLPETLKMLARRVLVSATSNSFGTLHLPQQRNVSQTHKNKYGQDYESPTSRNPVYTGP